MSSTIVIAPEEIDPIIRALMIKEGFIFLSEEVVLEETPLQICRPYLARYDIYFDDDRIRSQSRKSELVFVRALIALILHFKGLTSVKIGAAINRDHATVLHLLKYDYTKSGHDYRYQAIATELIEELIFERNK